MRKTQHSARSQSSVLSPQSSSGFTLIELLVVVGIIALLIGILLPSLGSARNAAQRARVKAQLNSIRQALEAFKNDVGDYPESAKQLDQTDSLANGETAPSGVTITNTYLWGAQSLARAMAGRDYKGYVSRKRARNFDSSGNATWYYDYVNLATEPPTPVYESKYPREKVFFSEKSHFSRTRAPGNQEQLSGVLTQADSPALADDRVGTQIIMIDSFGWPILYYKANPHGRLLCDAEADGDGLPVEPEDQDRIPFYNLLDNDVFTGAVNPSASGVATSGEKGWKFGAAYHDLREMGYPCGPGSAADCEVDDVPDGFRTTFAKYIHDHRSEGASGGGAVRPVNPDTYLLISAGKDGSWGSDDDINNFGE